MPDRLQSASAAGIRLSLKVDHAAFTDQRGEMRQRCQVTRSTDRALRGNYRAKVELQV